MQRLNSVNPANTEARTRELLNDVQQAFGIIPNSVKVMANSPAVLESFVAFSQAMGRAGIGEKLHSQVKLTTSETNACDYCTSLLTAVGPAAGLTADDILSSRSASAADDRTDTALKFAEAVLESRGKVGGAELDKVRAVGFSDAEIVEIIASVVLGCFTNFLNNVAETTLDTPQAEPLDADSGSACATGACSVS